MVGCAPVGTVVVVVVETPDGAVVASVETPDGTVVASVETPAGTVALVTGQTVCEC